MADKKAEPKTKKVPVCGHRNPDYFIAGRLKADEKGVEHAVRGELRCSLLQGHDGDHFAEQDEDGKEVINGFWKS